MANQITEQLAGELQKDIEAALESVAEKYGVDLSCSGVYYDASQAVFQLLAASRKTNKDTDEKENWDRYCKLVGLAPEDFGTAILWGGKRYTIAGYDPRARENCIVLECSGVRYLRKPADVKAALSANDRCGYIHAE